MIAPARDETFCQGEADLRLEPPDPGRRWLRELAPQPLDQIAVGLERHEIRLRKIAVVLRLLLRAQRRRRLVARVEVESLLVDIAAGLVDLDLPADLPLDPLRS